jgi:nucleoside-diphosphate-sugar epimerase
MSLENYSDLNILITGGTGYIGYNFTLFLLSKGHKVILLVRPKSNLRGLEKLNNVKFHVYDGDYNSVEEVFINSKINIVFHLATHYNKMDDHENIELFNEVSIKLTSYLLIAAKKNKDFIGLINVGSIWQLNDKYDNAYTLFKLFQDKLTDFYSRSHNIKVLSLLLTDSYGPSDWRNKFLNQLAISINNDETFHVVNPNAKVDLIYIVDICRALFMTINIISLSDKLYCSYKLQAIETINLIKIINYTEVLTGRKIQVSFGDAKHNETENSTLSLPILPGWKPEIDLKSGLRLYFNIKGDS